MSAIYRKIVPSITLVVLMLALLPAIALAEWPVRPEDIPTPTPQPGKVGAGIELSVTGVTDPYYAVVQWQDDQGAWHDVDGWRSKVEAGRVLWFVTEDLFDAGPFRWVVYDDEGTLAISESFDLPSFKDQIVHVTVDIDWVTYHVQPGDTLASIAAEFYGDARRWAEILAANADTIQDPDQIAAGQVIILPPLQEE